MRSSNKSVVLRSILEKLISEIGDFHTKVADIPVSTDITPERIRTHLAENYKFDRETPLEAVIADVAEMMRNWSIQTTHPRYFGLFNPTANLASIVADALTALYNPQLAVWSHAPAANEIEQFTLRYLLPYFGFDPYTSHANFTTGGAEANLSAMLVALTHHFPDYGDDGLLEALKAQPLIYLAEEAHDSFAKIAHFTGIGRKSLRVIPADDQLKLNMSALSAQIKEDIAARCKPFMVVGTAGTTSAGVIDPLPEIAAFCQERQLWFHVDAAWGGAAVMSSHLRSYLRGIELADSITCDAHKWFSVSMGAGMFFCKHKASVSQTFRVGATYMPHKTSGTTDPYTTTIQWSRRFIGLKLFMTIAEAGCEKLAKQIEHQADMGELLRRKLNENGWKILNNTPLPVVCFSHSRLSSQQQSALLERLYAQGHVWISETLLHKRTPALRACITSYRTQADDVTFLVNALNTELKQF